MKKYTKAYMDYFGYTTADFIPCELCGSRSVDIHHIWARSIRKDLENDISNLMALCRECHVRYGDKKDDRDFLTISHSNFMGIRLYGIRLYFEG